MASSSDRSPDSGSAVMASALAGAVVGAAGLAWWLLSTAERRRQARHHLSQLQSALPGLRTLQQGEPAASNDAQLHDRVQQLNNAIDEVRRQLEQLQTQA